VNGQYDAHKAAHKAYVRRKYSRFQGMRIALHSTLKRFVEELLFDDQSPEAIAGRLSTQRMLPLVSKNSIYRYIESPHGRRVEAYRKARRKRRRGRKPWKHRWGDGRTSIDKRPLSINTRRYVGDAEGDFIVSGRSGSGILLVIVDRKLRAAFLEQILVPSIVAVEHACLRIKQRYPEWKTLTLDNDILFQKFKRLGILLGVRIYFCHPGHAWEKGAVENTNRVIRRDIPKRSDISRFSKWFIARLEDKLNRRVMHCLGFKTPSEVLHAHRKRKKPRRAC
jgi:IS30 family transposase